MALWNSGDSLTPSTLNAKMNPALTSTGLSVNTIRPESGSSVFFPVHIVSRATDGSQLSAKPLGDGTAGVINWIHDDTTGYLLHLTSGPNQGAAAACLGIGSDFSGIGITVSNKMGGNGIYLANNPTVRGSTAFGFYGRQFSDAAPLVHLDSNGSTNAPVMEVWSHGSAGNLANRWLVAFYSGFTGGSGQSLTGGFDGQAYPSFDEYRFVSNQTLQSNASARIYDESGVGPTISGSQFQVRTGSASSSRLVVDSDGTVTVNGSVAVTDTLSAPTLATSSGNTLTISSTVKMASGTSVDLTGARLSLRTLGTSVTSANMGVNEIVLFVGGASGATLAVRSNGTIYYFGSSSSTVG